MVSPNPSQELALLAESSTLYDSVKLLLETNSSEVLSTSFVDLDARILNNVSANLTDSLGVLKTQLDAPFQIMKDLGKTADTLPTTTAKEVTLVSNMINVEALLTIPSHVQILLASFRNAVEDPTTIYPRLICCEFPLAPEKLINFTKQKQLFNNMLQQEARGDSNHRSTPNSPRSAIDVIINVNSSLESASDVLCESVRSITKLSESLAAVQLAAENLKCVNEVVTEVTNQYEEIHCQFSHVMSMLRPGRKSNSFTNRDIDNKQEAIESLKIASSLIENLSSKIVDSNLLFRVQGGKEVLSDFASSFNMLLSQTRSAVSKIVATLRKYVSLLPIIAQELRHFFVPSGVKSLFMTPSPDLISLLRSIDDLKTMLSEPEVIEKSVSEGSMPHDSTIIATNSIEKFNQLGETQQRLVQIIRTQDFLSIIDQTIRETLEEILRDLGCSVVGMLNIPGENTDETNMGDLLKGFLASGSSVSGSVSKRAEERPAGLLENIIDHGSILGSLF